MITSTATITREYGPFPGVDAVHGLTYDGRRIWFGAGDRLVALDPAGGTVVDAFALTADAGTAYDGRHLFQLSGDRIQKIDPADGRVLASIPAPEGQCNSGLAWAEGALWVGRYQERRIFRIDPDTGEVLRIIESDRYVTGVTWTDGQLWHGTWEGDESDLRRIDPATGEVLERLAMPAGAGVSGLEADGQGGFFCGGGGSGRIRAVRRAQNSADTDSSTVRGAATVRPSRAADSQ